MANYSSSSITATLHRAGSGGTFPLTLQGRRQGGEARVGGRERGRKGSREEERVGRGGERQGGRQSGK